MKKIPTNNNIGMDTCVDRKYNMIQHNYPTMAKIEHFEIPISNDWAFFY